MTVCTATFERGVNGANVLTTDDGSATAWTSVDAIGGTIKYDNTHAYDRLSSKIVITGGASSTSMSWTLGTLTDHYGRLYLWTDSYPTGDSLRLSATAPNYLFIRLGTDGKFGVGAYNGGGFSLSTPIALGQWVRLEWHMIHSLTVGQAELKLYNSPNSTSPTESQTTAATLDAGASITGMEFGSGAGSTSTATFWLDNIVAGAPSYPGPVDVSPQQLDVHHVRGLW